MLDRAGDATHAVPGEGGAHAPLMLVGEQPCDREDLTGKPFVGPGHILDRALAEAGVRRGEAFVTNAVKYFKYELRGKRRLHKPSRRGRDRGMPLVVDIERRLIRPGVIVALGASAARGVLGRPVTIAKACDLIETLADGTPVRVTIHPSLFQCLRTENEKHAEYERFIDEATRRRGTGRAGRLAHSPPLARLSRPLPTSSALTGAAALSQALRR